MPSLSSKNRPPITIETVYSGWAGKPWGAFLETAGNRLYKFCRIFLGLFFIWSGGSKLFDPQSFAIVINAYGLIPHAVIVPAAFSISLIEVVAGAGMVFDVRGTLSIITGLLIFFMLVLGYGLWLGLDVDCGCFGPQDPEGQAYHGLRPALYRDMFMLTGIGFLYYWRSRMSVETVGINRLFGFFIKGGSKR